MALLVGHHGQHQVHQIAAGTEHLVGTLRDTEQTACAALGEMLEGEGTRRGEGRLTLRSHLVLEFCQTAIHQFLLFLGHSGTSHHRRSQQERALAGIDGRTRFTRFSRCFGLGVNSGVVIA